MEEEGVTMYLLCFIVNGEVKTFTSVEDAMAFMGEIQSNPEKYQSVIIITGVNTTGSGSMIMTLDQETYPITTPITITKIERKFASSHNWKYTDNTMAKIKCTCVECREENKDGVTLTIGQDAANYTAGPEGTEWIVFGTEDQDANGIYENVLITTKTPSSEKIELSGADAYINGIAQIEAKVDEIYGAEARSMTIEDVNRALNFVPKGGMYSYDGSTYQYYNGFETTYREYLIGYCTWNYKKENSIEGELTAEQQTQVEAEVAEILADMVGPEEGKDVGSYKINGYEYISDSKNYSQEKKEILPITISREIITMVFGNVVNFSEEIIVRDMNYALASRGIIASNGKLSFGIFSVVMGEVGVAVIFNSATGASNVSNFNAFVRPIVSLGANVHSVVGE